MLYHLLYPWAETVKLFNLFKYISFRSITAAVIALIVTVLYGHYFIRSRGGKVYSIKKFIPDNHHKKQGTPSMGGLIIFVGLMSAMLVSGNYDFDLVTLTLLAFFGFGAIGYLDDHIKVKYRDGKGISPRLKISLQLLLSSAIVLYLAMSYDTNPVIIFYPSEQKLTYSYIFLPFFKDVYFDLKFSYWFFAIFILIASSNAVNITDGLDGLAVGLSLFVIVTYIVISYLTGHKLLAEYLNIVHIAGAGELTVFLCALAGACLGFLWYNSHPAQVFMGDTGSLALGGVMGLVAILLKVELLLPIIGGLFVIEALSVIIQIFVFKKWKKKFFKMSPLHHHFELLGWHENKIISRFWIAGILLALIGVATLKIR